MQQLSLKQLSFTANIKFWLIIPLNFCGSLAYVSWSNGQYCLFDMSSFSPSMVTAQQWNFVIVNIPVVTYNVSWTSIRTLNGKYLFHHTIHSSSEDFLLFLIFSLLSTSQFLYYFQCCVVFSVGTICVLQYDVLYWLVWYCLSGVVKFLKFCLEALVFLASISMSGDVMFEMRHTHIIFFTWLYWWNCLSFTIFFFLLFSIFYQAYILHTIIEFSLFTDVDVK